VPKSRCHKGRQKNDWRLFETPDRNVDNGPNHPHIIVQFFLLIWPSGWFVSVRTSIAEATRGAGTRRKLDFIIDSHGRGKSSKKGTTDASDSRVAAWNSNFALFAIALAT